MNKEIFVKLLAQRQFKAVRSILDVMNEVDIASLLSDLDDKELALAFRLIPKDKAAEVFANMNNSMQTYLVEMFSEKELKELPVTFMEVLSVGSTIKKKKDVSSLNTPIQKMR